MKKTSANSNTTHSRSTRQKQKKLRARAREKMNGSSDACATEREADETPGAMALDKTHVDFNRAAFGGVWQTAPDALPHLMRYFGTYHALCSDRA